MKKPKNEEQDKLYLYSLQIREFQVQKKDVKKTSLSVINTKRYYATV